MPKWKDMTQEERNKVNDRRNEWKRRTNICRWCKQSGHLNGECKLKYPNGTNTGDNMRKQLQERKDLGLYGRSGRNRYKPKIIDGKTGKEKEDKRKFYARKITGITGIFILDFEKRKNEK
jgi:hypothetical protein